MTAPKTPQRIRLVPDHSDSDLPTRWDGMTLEWSEWETVWTSAEWHLPKESCEVCGCTDVRPMSHGKVIPEPGATFTCYRPVKMKSGRFRDVAYEKPAWPVVRFMAFRCPRCGLDTVWDSVKREEWSLDASDYGPKGSVAS